MSPINIEIHFGADSRQHLEHIDPGCAAIIHNDESSAARYIVATCDPGDDGGQFYPLSNLNDVKISNHQLEQAPNQPAYTLKADSEYSMGIIRRGKLGKLVLRHSTD